MAWRGVRRNVRGFLSGSAEAYHRLEKLVDPLLMLVGALALPALLTFVVVSILRWYVWPIDVTVAAGNDKGESYAIARALALRLEASYGNVRIHVVDTAGTEENLERLRSKEADIAAAQADVALNAWTHPKTGDRMTGGVVAALHLDKFQLLICPDPQPLGAETANGGRRRVVPAQEALARRDDGEPPMLVHLPKGGGQQVSFEHMAAVYRLRPGRDYVLDDDSNKATAPCGDAEYGNLIFRVRAEGNKSIAHAIDLGWRLVDFPYAASVWSSSRALSRSSIPAGLYRAPGDDTSVPEPIGDTQTIEVPRLFVARTDGQVPGWLIYEITRILNTEGAALARLAQKGQRNPEQIRNLFLDIPNFNSKERLAALGVPLHPESAKYYDPTLTLSNWVSNHAEAISLTLTGLTILVSILIALNRLFRWWRRNNVEELMERATLEMAPSEEYYEPQEGFEDLVAQADDCHRAIDAMVDGPKKDELRESIYKLVDGHVRLHRLSMLFAEAGQDFNDEKISEQAFRTFNATYRAAKDAVEGAIEEEKRGISGRYVAEFMQIVRDVSHGVDVPPGRPHEILNESSRLMSHELVFSRDSFRTLTDAFTLATTACGRG